MRLDSLLGTMTSERFFAEIWEKRPLHLKNQDPDRFTHYFKLEQLDALIASLPQEIRIGVIKNDIDKPNEPGNKSSVGSVICDLYEKFAEGNTLIVNSMHKYWPPVRDMCNQLGHETGFKTQANMYVTPPGSTGFSPHWDDHEVLILQVEGSKAWRIYGNGPTLPPRSQHDPIAVIRQRTLNPGDPIKELIMNPGDVLYLPRGFVHNATATDTSSVHLTLGMNAISWTDLIVSSLNQFSKSHQEYRECVPWGSIGSMDDVSEEAAAKCRELLHAAIDKLDFSAGKKFQAQALVRSMEPPPTGHFLNMTKIDSVDLDTVVTRRTNVMAHVIEEADYCALLWPGYYQQGPDKMILAFDFIARTETFKVGDIPGWYSPEEKIRTVRHLIKKGFLTFTEA